ncbi:DNA cytosine methyltransferase [Salimicrobium salexigens]|uniref:DNA (cytosine-5-)-methyltransferase n=1 Tax=Salimicrobium salexigens TaxID=908941 RepID=A0ABY1KXV8_9BACI|nr:DNA cytosine methyltransferase [Salimicrobium salexigens]SIS90211.1 DNA (cytosine-5)-methyltransferase 1 [Salimicrobium salexigens]
MSTLKSNRIEEEKYLSHKSDISVIDLFSGCGGMALGFGLQNFHIAESVELDPAACRTANYNLHIKSNSKSSACNFDVKNYSFSVSEKPESKVVTIGGPPCQAYSNIGKAKIRSLGEDRFGLNDSRAFLYEEFLRVALDASSDFIVMENVPEAVNFFGKNLGEEVCAELEKRGYRTFWTILNAADYGVPQVRERLFVFAAKEKYGEPYLPEPVCQRPDRGFKTPNEKRFKTFLNYSFFKEPKQPSKAAPLWVTAGEAVSDLPSLFKSADSIYQYYKSNVRLPYESSPLNYFQNKMRENTRGAAYVSGNSFRYTARDFRIFEEMNWGDDFRQAFDIADNLFRKEAARKNITKKNNPEEYNLLRKKFVPPYDREKFHSKWKKLHPGKPSHTLVAHLGTDTYSHIHPYEPRGISIREAARLQSFPDDFMFHGSMGDAYRQIGNAVPPLLSEAIAKAVKRSMKMEEG